MMMVMVVIVVLSGGISRKARLRYRCRVFRWWGTSVIERDATTRTKSVYSRIGRAARRAATWEISLAVVGRTRGFLRVHFEGEALNGFQRGPDRFLAGLGSAHIILQAGEELVDGRVLR
jgi:hypothetical protein